MTLNKPEWWIILIGCICSIISGAIQPAFAIVFSRVINVFQECDITQQKQDIQLYCAIFVGLGVVTFISNILYVIEEKFKNLKIKKVFLKSCL